MNRQITIMAAFLIVTALLVYYYSQAPTVAASCCNPCCGCAGGCNVNCSCNISSNPCSWPSGDRVWLICHAAAMAEGANESGSVPDRYNNPGDLSQGDEHGQSIIAYVTTKDRETLIYFATKSAGWQALYAKWNNIVQGKSSVYPPSLTWTQVAQRYAGNWQNWLNSMTSILGVDANSTPAEYFNA